MKYLKLFNESFNIEDVEDYLLSLTDIGYLKFEGYTFQGTSENSDRYRFQYYLVYNYTVDSKFIDIRTSDDMMEYSKFLANLSNTCDRWKLQFQYTKGDLDNNKLSVRHLIPSKINKFLNDNRIKLVVNAYESYMYSSSISINIPLINDIPISTLSHTKLEYITAHSLSLTLSQDLDFILSIKIMNNYQYYKSEDVSKSFINTIKGQLGAVIEDYGKDVYKFIISSKN